MHDCSPKNRLLRLTLFLLALPPFVLAEEKAPATINNVSIMGIKLADATLDSVRQQLWDIGGFTQAKSSWRQRHFDKFFALSRMRDSYYLTFTYNHAQKVVSVKRLYRHYSVLNNNQHTAITTRDVASSLISEIGQPTATQHKSGGGFPSYPSYRWDSDEVSIVVDREGSEKLGKVFVEYTLKQVDPYAVANNDANANQQRPQPEAGA